MAEVRPDSVKTSEKESTILLLGVGALALYTLASTKDLLKTPERQFDRATGFISDQLYRGTGFAGEQFNRGTGFAGEQFNRGTGFAGEQFNRFTGWLGNGGLAGSFLDKILPPPPNETPTPITPYGYIDGTPYFSREGYQAALARAGAPPNAIPLIGPLAYGYLDGVAYYDVAKYEAAVARKARGY